MLKYLLFITAIILCEIFNYSKVQSGFSITNFVTGEAAKQQFINEETKIADEFKERENKIIGASKNLSVWTTLKKLFPPKTWNPFRFVWQYFQKFFQVGKDLINIARRDWGKFMLNRAKHKNKKEKLIEDGGTGVDICQRAFNHNYFKNVRRWILVTKRKETKSRKQSWIKVQTFQKTGREKYWRTSKRCMAVAVQERSADDKTPFTPSKSFPVYISAAEGHGSWFSYKIFVFTDTPWDDLDDYDRWVFFWHHVVQVDAYLT